MMDTLTEPKLLKELAKYQKSKAERLNGEATTAEIVQRLQKAQDLLDEAIRLLLPVYDVADVDYKETLRRELADCYGMKGGIFRRWATLEEEKANALLHQSAEMYNEGLKYEINDSYNLVNSIVVEILLDPVSLEKQYPRINNCVVVLQEQVKGSRIDQWWAWADLGLCNLLLEREDGARFAYERFTKSGSRAQDYDSTLAVLRDLESTLQERPVPRLQSIAMSINRVVVFLWERRGA